MPDDCDASSGEDGDTVYFIIPLELPPRPFPQAATPTTTTTRTTTTRTTKKTRTTTTTTPPPQSLSQLQQQQQPQQQTQQQPPRFTSQSTPTMPAANQQQQHLQSQVQVAETLTMTPTTGARPGKRGRQALEEDLQDDTSPEVVVTAATAKSAPPAMSGAQPPGAFVPPTFRNMTRKEQMQTVKVLQEVVDWLRDQIDTEE